MLTSAFSSCKATASGWIGSALEYYDFFIYATAASLIFPQIFFPKTDPKVAMRILIAAMNMIMEQKMQAAEDPMVKVVNPLDLPKSAMGRG